MRSFLKVATAVSALSLVAGPALAEGKTDRARAAIAEARGKVEGQMQGLAKSLERDPQVESILRNRRQEIGIGQHMRQSEGISRELQQSLTRGRSLGLER